jgi:N-acetylmuramoyl-L-alanine amidase
MASPKRRRFAARRLLARSASAWLALLLACPVVVASASARPERDLYLQAKRERERLESSPKRMAKRSEWAKVIARFQGIVSRYPRSPYCDDALMASGDLYRSMADRFKRSRYWDNAVKNYRMIVAEYPSSSLREPALFAVFEIARQRGDRADLAQARKRYLARFPRSQNAREVRNAKARSASAPRKSLPKTSTGDKKPVRVFNLRSWSGKRATRVVLDLERPVKYQRGQLENPDRLFIDLLGTRLHHELTTRSFPIGDGLLKQARVGQFNDEIVRVVLDLKKVDQDTIFYLADPTRLVIDVSGPGTDNADGAPERSSAGDPPRESSDPPSTADPDPKTSWASSGRAAPTPPRPNSSGSFSLVRQFGLGVRRIVIDPGHGGHDPGTVGRSGLQEKDLVLDVSLRVARMVRERLGIDVVMTRSTDVYVPLEERTAIANAREADLFLSIHANSSRRRQARGIETYYLNFAVDAHAEEVAARENAISPATVKDLSALVKAITQNSKIQESRDFAANVQRAMIRQLHSADLRVPDRGVRRAPFYVLLGARMPSILVEISFISNEIEERLLKTSRYRNEIAEGILEGVAVYIEALNGSRAPRLTYSAGRPKVAGREARR